MEVHVETAHFGRDLMPVGTACAVHQHTSFAPLEWHHIWPLGLGGADTNDNRLRVCANGHYMIHEFMRQLIITGGRVEWNLAQHFGPKVRNYAKLGWERAGKPTKGNAGE